MHGRTPEELELLSILTAGALSGFGDVVASGKFSPEKAAHKAVVMAEAAISEMMGKTTLGAMGDQKTAVYEKPDR